jgi:arylsulfatase A-like enzyme
MPYRFFPLIAISLAVLGFVDASAKENSPRPNFVFILVDDLGWNDLAVEGSSFYETPNIDGLARSGMRFLNGYAACQVCSPSRASIQLGKYPTRHGITDYIGAKDGKGWNRNDKVYPAEYVKELPSADTTIAEAMKAAGYRTFFAGKWHLGGEGSMPTDHGYEVNRGGNSTGTPKGGFYAPFENAQLEDGLAGESLSCRLGKETSAFIESHRDENFFAFLSFYAVHAPLETTQPRWKKFQTKAKLLPEPAERFSIDRTMPVRQVQDHPVYAGLVEEMDEAVGLVLDALKKNGLEENTVVIFTSDNGGVSSGDGYATSNLPLRGGKGRQWEGGLRVAYHVRAPGITKPGSTSSTPVIGIDFYPTILDLAGVSLLLEQLVDGKSIVPLLRGQSMDARPLFWHYPHYGNQGGEPSSIIHQGDWKLIHYWEDGRNELYRLSDDPSELHDLASQESKLAMNLWSELDAWLKSTNAKTPTRDPRYKPEMTTDKQQKVLAEKPRLEKQHARVLDDDFQPDPTWWGSKPSSKL